MVQAKRFRLDHPWSIYAFKLTVATAGHLLAMIGRLCLPIVRLAFAAFTTVLLHSFGAIRKFYVKILTLLFDYATRIKKDKEILFNTDLFHLEPSSSSILMETKCRPEFQLSTISESSDYFTQLSSETSSTDQELPDDDLLSSSRRSSLRKSRLTSQADIQFNLDDIIDYTRQGLEAIVDDEVTKRFTSSEETGVWNLLTRTQQHKELFSLRVTLLWFTGFLVRYFLLFPYRICLFFLAMFWMLVASIFLNVLPIGDAKLRFGFYINIVLYRILSRVFSAIITYHNVEHRAQRASICVANHTSPIDVIILSTDNSFSMIGQRHGGFFGLVQRCLSQTANHIWFERSETKDRHMVAEQMREHIRNKDNLPILIFPEGTCINNTSVMMFKKGCFEINEATIYPVAIKYDNRFGDAFWNSAKHQLLQYLILMMTSWAIVVDIYYLPPMKMEKHELSIDFAGRVKAAIAKQGGFANLEWDGGLKRALPKADLKAEEQRKFYQMLKTE